VNFGTSPAAMTRWSAVLVNCCVTSGTITCTGVGT
jgi:hypothetical protein